MASMWTMDEGDQYRNQTKNQRDIQTQSVISVAFGLIAFISFCVSWCRAQRKTLVTDHMFGVDLAAQMDQPLCSTQAPEECGIDTTGATRYILWMDTGAISYNRGGGVGIGRT